MELQSNVNKWWVKYTLRAIRTGVDENQYNKRQIVKNICETKFKTTIDEMFATDTEIFANVLDQNFEKIFANEVMDDEHEFDYYSSASNFNNYNWWVYEFKNYINNKIENNYTKSEQNKYKTQFKKQIDKFYTIYMTVLEYHVHLETQKKDKFIENYMVIANIQYMASIIDFINSNYNEIFTFKYLTLFQVILKKKIQFIENINEYLDSNEFTRKQCKILLDAKKTFEYQPKRTILIGCVLNRIFIKDIALIIGDYI